MFMNAFLVSFVGVSIHVTVQPSTRTHCRPEIDVGAVFPSLSFGQYAELMSLCV